MIIRPFNAVFSGVLVLAFAAIILMWMMLRQKSEKMRTMTIVIIVHLVEKYLEKKIF